MEAGKFFISLGLNGAEKMAGGLAQINDHFSGLKGISTEAKLAILGALAGLEQMAATSGKFGNTLTTNTAYLNMNKQAIQEWENANIRAGGTAGQMVKQFQGIRDHMLDIWSGNGPKNFLPQMFAIMQAQGQKFTEEEKKGQANYWAEHPDELFKHFLALHPTKELSKSKLGYMMSIAGIDTDVTGRNATLGAFNAASMAQARKESLSNSDIAKLTEINKQWKDFEITSQQIMMLFSTGLLPVVKNMEKAAEAIRDALKNAISYRDLKEHLAARPSQSNDIFRALHPDVPIAKTEVIVHAPIAINGMANDIGDLDKKIDVVITNIWTKTISKLSSTKAQ